MLNKNLFWNFSHYISYCLLFLLYWICFFEIII